MEGFGQDVRFAWRWARRSPGFTLIVLLTLALGIGANTVMFSVVNAVLLRPLPFPQPERLASVWPEKPLSGGPFVEFRDRSRSFERLAAYSDATGFSLSGNGRPERVEGAYVSSDFFRVLGPGAVLGRTLLSGDDQPGRDRFVVLSQGLWQQRFGAGRGIVGREIVVDGVSRTVVGVMPSDFTFPSQSVRLWVPLSLDASNPGEFWGGGSPLHVVGRLRPGVSLEQADAEIRTLAPQVLRAAPWPLPNEWVEGAGAAPLRNLVLGDTATPLLVLMAAVAVVLLIACANIANLLLARSEARKREVATRAALGASRRRIIRQLLTESVLLSSLGGGAGLLLAVAGVPALTALLPSDIPRAAEIGIDGRVLSFTLALAALTGIAFGLLPALRASQPNLQLLLKDGGKGTAGVAHRRISAALVVSEVALAAMLVVAAGLLVRSLVHLLDIDTGFRAEQVVTARISPPKADYAEDERIRVFYDNVLERVRVLPGVEIVASVHRLPLGGESGGMPIQVEGRSAVPGAAAPFAAEWRVSPAYVGTMAIPLLRGRGFTDADRDGAPHVALVNQAMARRFWPRQDPVGKRFRPVWWNEWVTVVGVVGNVKDQGLASEEQLEVYRPFAQGPVSDMNLVIRTRSAPDALAGSLRKAVWSVDPNVPVSDVRTMEQVVLTSLSRPQFTMVLLSVFAALALGLGAVGIYGVIAYAVSQRTQEIGIRIALGATPGLVLGLELRRGVVLAAAGVVIGLFAGIMTTRLLGSLLFNVSPIDPLILSAVALAVLGVALLASYLPARRATRVNPVAALRAD
jgi:putative ABC transport system permease protein